jgi:tetratricopeptide (TPR) repeat protein
MTSVRRPSAAAALTSDAAGRLLSLFGSNVGTTLRRCAVPDTFDPETYRHLLRPNGGPELTLMETTGQVEPAPGEPGRYRLPPSIRTLLLSTWWDDAGAGPAARSPVPEELKTLAGQLAQRAGDQQRDLEELDLRLLAGAEVAEDLFRTMYDAADREHDLGRCRAILDVLTAAGRRQLLDPSLAALAREYGTYLAARKRWVHDYYRSARYTARQDTETELEHLLAGRSLRVLQLYADGGMGKSTQLRWLIARRCVPARVPCARLDFDELSPVAASRHPWLLLLEAAAQLDQQIDGLPFQELLSAYGHYRTLLTRNPAARTRGPAPRHASRGEGEDIRERFVDALSARATAQPVVLVLDTVEKVLLRSMDPAGIVTLLSGVVDEVSVLRLIMAGRFDLRERIDPGLLPDLASHRLELLTPDQQRDYLVRIRGVDEDVAVQIELLSEGRPLTLATYADLVLRSDRVTAAELATCREPGLLTAIQRYVEEIEDDGVRWLVRYGVIPRRLRYDFVASVMRPFLVDAMAGNATWDDPVRDDRPGDDAQVTFRTDLDPPADDHALREIWDTLVDYASDYGWISVADDEPEALQIRGDVLRPLRDLIRGQMVFGELQRAAGDYYERRAETEPDRWLSWMRETVFHRFQQNVESGYDTWRGAVDRARTAGREDHCLDLATELLTDDYVNRSGDPVAPMTPAVLAMAHLERARSAVSLAEQNEVGREDLASGLGPEDPLWNEAEAGWEAARSLQEGRPDVWLPASHMAVVGARLALARGDPERAEALLLAHRPELPPSPALADLERTLGRTMLARRIDGAAAHLQRSYDLAREAGDLAGARESVFALVNAHGRASNYAAWSEVVAQARRDAVIAADDPDGGLIEGLLLALSGGAARVREVVRAVTADGGLAETDAQVVLAIACLRVDDLPGTVEAADRALDLAASQSSRVDSPGIALEVRAAAYAELLDVDRSVADAMAAASRARELADHNAAAEHAAVAAMVLTEIAGQLSEAAQLLDEAHRSGPDRGSAGWLRTRLATARLQRALGEPAAAATTLREILDGESSCLLSAEHLTDVVVGLLTVAPAGDQAALVQTLVTHAGRITPPGIRLFSFRDFDDVPVLDAPDGLLQRLRRLLVDEPEAAAVADGLTVQHRAAGWWRAAEVLRAVGRPDEARRMLDAALSARGADMLGWWRWLNGTSRLGAATVDEPCPPDGAFAASETLAVGFHLALAARRVHLDPVERVIEHLTAAAKLLGGSRHHRSWARLWAIWADVELRRDNEHLARRHASHAAAAYGALGDVRNRNAVADRFDLGNEEQHEDSETVELRFGQLLTDRLDIEVDRADGATVRSVVSTHRFGDAEDSAQSLARLRTVLGPLTHGWSPWSHEVAEYLLSPELRAALTTAGGPERDLRLVFEGRDAAVLPWELTRAWDANSPLVQAPSVGTLYRGLGRSQRADAETFKLQQRLGRLGYFKGVADGLSGAQTDRAVRELQRDAGVKEDGQVGTQTWSAVRRLVRERLSRRPLRAVLVRPGSDREAERQRGYAAAGQEPVSAYLGQNIELVVVEDPGPDTLDQARDLFDEGAPDLVHVMSPVRLIGGATVLDFGVDSGDRWLCRGESAPGALTVRLLGDLCSMWGRNAKLPLIMLDIPLPHSRSEAIRSLGVRNSFAYQLMKLGVTEAVLAMGLAPPAEQVRILDQILGDLAAGLDVAAVARRLQRSRPPENFTTTLAYAGAALSLDGPPCSLLPVGY